MDLSADTDGVAHLNFQPTQITDSLKLDSKGMILLIETATSVCSVVLSDENKILARRQSAEPNAHSSRLAVFVDEVFKEAGVNMSTLDAVCVSSGPGSYTGLRIGVSAAKGLCFALDKPLLSVPTLQNMAALYYRQHPEYQGWVCPMIDARRMECYAAIFNRSLEEVKPTSADIVGTGIYDTYLNEQVVTFVGDGAEKTRELLGVHPNAHYDSDYVVSAEGMVNLAVRKLSEGKVEDVAYFVPFYLKDFVAKKPVVKGLK